MHDFEESVYYGVHGKVELTKLENKLLNILIKNKGAFVRYRRLIKYLYNQGEENAYLINNVATCVHRLRQKTKDDFVIKTKSEVGYRID